MALPFTETFTNANFTALSTHNANWTHGRAGAGQKADIFGNGARNDTGTSSNWAFAYWSGDSFGAAQSAQCDIVTSHCGLIVRASGQDSTFRAYLLWRTENGNVRLYKCHDEQQPTTDIGGGVIGTAADGDKIKLEITSGNVLKAYKDTGGGFSQLGGDVTDGSYASGSAGFMVDYASGANIDNVIVDGASGGGGGSLSIPVALNQYRQRWR